jgi:serine/threonine protein kinase
MNQQAKYPMRGDYATAVRNLHLFIYDGVLKNGKAFMNPTNPQLLLSYNGGKAIVFKIEANQKAYGLKCWVEDLGDLKTRYKHIDEYLKTVKLPYFTDFAYTEQGILVNGTKYPIIRMEWVAGIELKAYIAKHIKNPAALRQVANHFLQMVTDLHKNQISHGDLQHGNLLIRPDGSLCLVDYDSLYVPSLKNQKDYIKGLPGYQHPNREKLVSLSPKSDYFSELVIYLSLIALAEAPNLWNQIADEEHLLFKQSDFEKPNNVVIFKELKNLSKEVQELAEKLKSFCLEKNIEQLVALETIVKDSPSVIVDDKWDFPQPPKTPIPPAISIPIKPDDGWSVLDTPIKPSQPDPNGWDVLSNPTWDDLFDKPPDEMWDKAFSIPNKPSTVSVGTNKQSISTTPKNLWQTMWEQVKSWFREVKQWLR